MCLLKRFIFSKMHFEWNINLFKDKFNKNSCINSSHFAHILWYSKFEFQPSFPSLLTWHCLAVKVWWTVESISDWKPPFNNFEIAMFFLEHQPYCSQKTFRNCLKSFLDFTKAFDWLYTNIFQWIILRKLNTVLPCLKKHSGMSKWSIWEGRGTWPYVLHPMGR